MVFENIYSCYTHMKMNTEFLIEFYPVIFIWWKYNYWQAWMKRLCSDNEMQKWALKVFFSYDLFKKQTNKIMNNNNKNAYIEHTHTLKMK